MSGLSDALGDLLPAALGIAISPLPVIASVLMLLSPRANRTAPAFAVGWVIGLTTVTVAAVLVAGPSVADTGSGTTRYWIKLTLGVLFVGLGARAWMNRPREGEEASPPKWMAGLDGIGPVSALGLGAALAAVNPKNLALGISGGVAIASADLDGLASAVCVMLFVAIGSVMVAGPAAAYFAARDAMATPLNELKVFMQVHNAAIMTVLLGVLGLSNFGKGLGGLIG